MPRRRLTAGESIQRAISASVWNELVDLLDHKDRVGLWSSRDQDRARQLWHSASIFWAYNSTGNNLAIGDSVGISDVMSDTLDLYDEREREITLAAAYTGVSVDFRRRFALCVDPIPIATSGRVCLSGVCLARIDITDTEQTHGYAVEEQPHLAGNFGGAAEIIAKPTGIGIKRCVVQLRGGPVRRKATADEVITAGTNGTVNVLIGGTTVGQVEAYLDWMTAGITSLPNGAKMIIEWFDDEAQWIIVSAECEA